MTNESQAAWNPAFVEVAEAFHIAYEALAPDYGYKTREESAVSWADVPEDNKQLMIATVARLIGSGVIRYVDNDAISIKMPGVDEKEYEYLRQEMLKCAIQANPGVTDAAHLMRTADFFVNYVKGNNPSEEIGN